MIAPPDPPLGDGVVGLRPLDERDLGALERAASDEGIVRAFGAPPADPDETVGRGGRGGETAARPCSRSTTPALRRSVSAPSSSSHARRGAPTWATGSCRTRADEDVRRADCGSFSEWALRSLPIGRVQLWTTPENVASQRVAERAGFTREGVLRSYGERDGRRVDAVFFSLLPEDVDRQR